MLCIVIIEVMYMGLAITLELRRLALLVQGLVY